MLPELSGSRVFFFKVRCDEFLSSGNQFSRLKSALFLAWTQSLCEKIRELCYASINHLKRFCSDVSLANVKGVREGTATEYGSMSHDKNI
jgi:hypothetical protein